MWRSIGKVVLFKTFDVKVQVQNEKYSFSYGTSQRFFKTFDVKVQVRFVPEHWVQRFEKQPFSNSKRRNGPQKKSSLKMGCCQIFGNIIYCMTKKVLCYKNEQIVFLKNKIKSLGIKCISITITLYIFQPRII